MTKSKKGQHGEPGQLGEAGKQTELDRLVDIAEQVGDSLNEEKNRDHGFFLVVNHGKHSTASVIGTSEALSSALYTSCKSSEEMSMIVLAVAAEIVGRSIKDRDKGYSKALMGPKGDA